LSVSLIYTDHFEFQGCRYLRIAVFFEPSMVMGRNLISMYA
jgi:hypothetical protein